MSKASSMIELVIAIVVMGIAIMTLPLMLTRTQNNNAFAIQQEAILASRTQIGDILTYPWDENSKNNTYVLDTNSTYFKRETNSTRRKGHVKGYKRRKLSSTPTYASSVLGIEVPGVYDDIDDFNSGAIRKVIETNGTAIAGLDYKFDFNMSTNVVYVKDNYVNGTIFELNATALIGQTSNIKMIELQAKGGDINLKLRAYSTNIGENELLRRTW